MKEITWKQIKKSSSLLKAIKTKQGNVEKESKVANECNKYFTSEGTALASKILMVTKLVLEYLPQCNASMENKELSFQEYGNIITDAEDSIKVIHFKTFKATLEKVASKSQKLFQLLKKR